MSFGYHRAEILGALLSVLLIWGVAGALVIAAVHRIAAPEKVEGGLMLLTATIGTAANLFMAHILHIHSHGIGRVHTGSGEGHPPPTAAGAAGGDTCCCSTTKDAAAPVPAAAAPPAAPPAAAHAHAAGCCSTSRHTSSSHPKHQDHRCEETTSPLLQQPHGSRDTTEQQQAAAAAAAAGGDVYMRMEEDPETEIESMNLRAAYIHALGDLLQNIGVMIASAIIWYVFKP